MKKVVLVFLMCLTACYAQSVSDTTTSANRQELLDGYHLWGIKHPEAKSASGTLMIRVPTIDLYSPDGQAVYHVEGDPQASAVFIKSLPAQLPRFKALKTTTSRPSLREAIEMFSGLRNRESDLLSSGKYTVFSVTFLHWEYAKAQNDAIDDLRRRLKNTDLQIIEIGQLR
jgi:hypothetical protein